MHAINVKNNIIFLKSSKSKNGHKLNYSIFSLIDAFCDENGFTELTDSFLLDKISILASRKNEFDDFDDFASELLKLL